MLFRFSERNTDDRVDCVQPQLNSSALHSADGLKDGHFTVQGKMLKEDMRGGASTLEIHSDSQ